MAIFTVLDEDGILRSVANQLGKKGLDHQECRFNPPIKHAFEDRAVDWPRLRELFEEERIDGVLVSPFLRKELPTGCYLLAPVRAAERQPTVQFGIKMILIAPDPAKVNLQRLILPLDDVRTILFRTRERDGDRLKQAAQQALGSNSPTGECLIVDDKPEGRDNMKRVFPDPHYVAVDFGEAHKMLLHGSVPSLIISDTLEYATGDMTGLGLVTLLRSTPHLQDVPVILYSEKFYGDADMRKYVQPFQAAFELGPRTAQKVHTVLT